MAPLRASWENPIPAVPRVHSAGSDADHTVDVFSLLGLPGQPNSLATHTPIRRTRASGRGERSVDHQLIGLTQATDWLL